MPSWAQWARFAQHVRNTGYFGKEKQMTKYTDIFDAVDKEVATAQKNWPPMNSAHEAYGVLLEEVDELKAHVWMKQKNRDLHAMQKEAIQVAAMAIRFALEVCDEETGRKCHDPRPEGY